MRNLAIIPARGGSKRIPRKNIKPFLQKPILAYSIEVALASNIFDEVMVSTDDQEIAEVAKAYGAKVPFVRSEANANDTATIADVILEVLTYYKTKNQHPEIICCLFATAPFVEKKILTEGFQKVQSNGYSSAFTIQKFDYPIFR
ncbi:MAG: pseudaminic acid cytidylyltransferase, partial [Cyclobacteriaceae bacterium]|nr:pseudaminic acid cytidylyltransferase [Cyclobacteriaceae bacterium HetDA_MAG_MS6]